MPTTLNKFKQHSVLYVNILFTLFCVLFPLSSGMQFVWFAMWILVPILLPTDKTFMCLTYMSLYMRVQSSIKLFSILICISFFIILIKELIFLNKNKLLNKYFKIILFYFFLLVLALFYSIFINKTINISFIYYLNMINLLFLLYLLKNKLNYKIILLYCYGIIISSALALICFGGGLHHYPFDSINRFCAFMPLCNSLGVSCVICIASIYVLLVNNKLNKPKAIVLMCVLSVIGITTLSKNFLLAFALTLAIILISQFKNCQNKKKFLKIGVIVLLALSPFILYYGAIMFERFFGDNGYTNTFDIITTGRLDKWLIYLKPWAKHLYSILFGLGIGFNYNTPYSSHSLYVGYLSKMGIVGLMAIGAFVYLLVFNKNKTALKFKYFPFIILAFICLAEDISYNTFNFIPFIIAIILTRQSSEV